MKKAIVTGANGFIGRFLIRELLKNNVYIYAIDRVQTDWRALDDLQIEKVECDLKDTLTLPVLIKDRDIDCIFHIGWQGASASNRVDAADYKIQLQNVESTLDLIEAAHIMNIKTFISSGSIHEKEIQQEMSENLPSRNPINMYKTAKIAAHWMGKTKAGEHGIRFLWTLLIGAYGEEDKPTSLISTVVGNIMNGESPDLSDGTQLYDFVHVSDIAHALYLIAEKGVDGKEYMIGSGNAKRLKDFLTEAGNIVNEIKGGEKIPLGFGKHKGKSISLPKEAFDTSSLVEDTGFQPQVSFGEGIKRTVEWIMKENSD